jgi:hypothetical protein
VDQSLTYLASAYLVFLGVLLLYVVIIASKLTRLRAELDAVREPKG